MAALVHDIALRLVKSQRLGYRSIGHRPPQTPEYYKRDMVKRIVRNPVISIESIDFKTPISAKSKQSWKYPGGNIVRAPAGLLPNLYDHDRGDGAKHPRRKQESNFFITINSNQAPKDAADVDESLRAMDNMLHELAKEDILATYLKFGPKHEDYRDDKFSDVVAGIDWKAATEMGPNQGRVHSHIWLTITHYSQIQINPQMLMYQSKRLYNANAFNFQMKRQPYVHVKLLPQSNWTDVMRQYIHKGMMGV